MVIVRKDLNKQLCERERQGSSKSFKQVRHNKKFKLDTSEDGDNHQHESIMHRHVRARSDTKSFNENLSPLKGQVRKAVGKRWDTFYSEFCKNFDMRSVINQHILQHLDQYCERDLFVENGELYVRGSWRYGGGTSVNLKDSSYTEFYVDPRDGIIKRNKWYKNKKREKQREAEKARELTKVYYEIDKDNVLHYIDDIWFHFILKDVKKGIYEIRKPEKQDLFDISYHKKFAKLKTWDQMDENDRKRFGYREYVGETVTDLFTGNKVKNDGYRNSNSATRYHAVKKTASHKMLKKAGLVK